MTLRITELGATVTCPRCSGTGRVPCPLTYAVRGSDRAQPGSGHPIPCPMCFGAKRVLAKLPLHLGEKR